MNFIKQGKLDLTHFSEEASNLNLDLDDAAEMEINDIIDRSM